MDVDDSFDAIETWHLQIHQRYIWTMRSELFDGFPSVGRLRNQLHVSFRVDQRCDSLAKERVVVDAKDSNRLRIAAHDFCSWRITGILSHYAVFWTQ